MHDEILELEAREQLREQRLDEFSVEAALDEMRDAGMFDAEVW